MTDTHSIPQPAPPTDLPHAQEGDAADLHADAVATPTVTSAPVEPEEQDPTRDSIDSVEIDSMESVQAAESADMLPDDEDGEPTAEASATLEDTVTEIDNAEIDNSEIESPEVDATVLASELTGLLEALLFVSDSPASPAQFAKALDLPEMEIRAGLADLQALYKQTSRGLRLQEHNDRFSLVTAPQAATTIEAFLNLDLSSRLSGPALEALAIVAYRQPVTKAQIEAVRGVDCGGVLRTLLQRELIEEVGRLETAGRPILYGVTDTFMQHFGLENMQELPPLQLPDADALWAATELVEEGE